MKIAEGRTIVAKKKQPSPGRYPRKGITQAVFLKIFPDIENPMHWFIQERRGDNSVCPHCGYIRAVPNQIGSILNWMR